MRICLPGIIFFKVKISTNPDLSYSAAISTAVPSPPAPTNVLFTAVSTTSLTATWDLAAGNSYLMVLSSTPSFSTILSSGTGALNQNTSTYLNLGAGSVLFPR